MNTSPNPAPAVTSLHRLQIRRPDLAADLTARAESARAHWSSPAHLLPAAPQDLPDRAHTDAVNAKVLRIILARHGWPGRSLVGEDGCRAAVRIAVHADHDPDFQRTALRMLRDAVEAGEAAPAQWAHLYDRVLARAGQPQVYGTQYRYFPGGRLEPHPIADPGNVEERRRALNLPPIAQQGARLGLLHTGPATGHHRQGQDTAPAHLTNTLHPMQPQPRGGQSLAPRPSPETLPDHVDLPSRPEPPQCVSVSSRSGQGAPAIPTSVGLPPDRGPAGTRVPVQRPAAAAPTAVAATEGRR